MNRILRRSAVLLLTAAALSGCTEFTGFVADFFTLSALPAADGGQFSTVQGGQVIAAVRIQNGANVRTEIKLLFAAPSGITAYTIGDSPPVYDVRLGPNEVRDLPIHIQVAADRPDGNAELRVIAAGLSHRSDIVNPEEFADTQTVSFNVIVGTDETPPTVTILDPVPGASFGLLPIRVHASAADQGTLAELSFQLNDYPVVSLWTGDHANPRSAIAQQFDLPEASYGRGPRMGANVLVVTASDALGHSASAAVGFTYEPTGHCEHFHIATSHAGVSAAPGGDIGLVATITPLGGWTGRLNVGMLPDDIFTWGSLSVFPETTGPVEASVRGSLRGDLVPGMTGYAMVRVKGLSEPASTCEAAVPITIDEPGAGAPPQVTIVTPASGYVSSSATVTLNATVTTDDSIAAVSFLTVAGAVTPEMFVVDSATASPFAFSRSVQLHPGNNRIEVRAMDGGGRSSSATVVVAYQPEGGTQCDNFTVTPASASIELSPGESGTLEFALTRIGGFSAPISLSIVEQFASAFFSSVAFVPNPTTTLGSTLQMTVVGGQTGAEFRGGTFGFTVVAGSGTSSCVTEFTVSVPDAG